MNLIFPLVRAILFLTNFAEIGENFGFALLVISRAPNFSLYEIYREKIQFQQDFVYINNNERNVLRFNTNNSTNSGSIQ